MSFSPVKASKIITDKYLRYLRTIFSIDSAEYGRQFTSELKGEGNFAKGPYLDVTDSFEKGKSIEELIEEGVLSAGFRKIAMPRERPLYRHQEIALRKALSGRNMIVSTGTGSGKTESFLIPILNHLLREKENGTLNPGVRALLIYPMNALANDQVERLRGLLADCPEITFGCYTGQTQETYRRALADYMALNDQQEPRANELIAREQIRNAPPHILITNYAMLEYLMVRPGDGIFFEGEHAGGWKYIVLDEAHVYNGGSGIEVAMLLRRLKARLKNDAMQYILTSATLGDEDANAEVAEFGSNLCDSRFEAGDVVRAFRSRPVQTRAAVPLSAAFYEEMAALLDQGASQESILECLAPYRHEDCTEENVGALLYDIVLHDANYIKIRSLVGDVKTVRELARQMNWTEATLSAFVTVAAKAVRGGDRLFDAKYHMFLRATESVFVTLKPSSRLFLTRKQWHEETDGTRFKVFELATCSRCHAPYLVGALNRENNCLEQSTFRTDDEPRAVFLFRDHYSDDDEDHSLENENLEVESCEICACCGFVTETKRRVKQSCEKHGDRFMVPVQRIKIKKENGRITKCPACENVNSMGILRSFFTGQEAVTSVLGTALFEELPSYEFHMEAAPVPAPEEDDGFGFDEAPAETAQKTEYAKQFIAFSDSRQAAAFYATYLERSYNTILYKRLIADTLDRLADPADGLDCRKFADRLAAQFDKHNICEDSYSSSKEAWKAILQEAIDNNSGTSLCSMGMAAFTVPLPKKINYPKWRMSAEELQTLSDVFMTQMMTDGAIACNEDVGLSQADKEFYTHNGAEGAYVATDSDRKKGLFSFAPKQTGKTNKRLDYLKRVLAKRFGVQAVPEDADEEAKNRENRELGDWLLKFWDRAIVPQSMSPESDPVMEYDKKKGGYRISAEKVRLFRPERWYVCSKCRNITPYNLENVCPGYRCEGTLQSVDPQACFADNHYYRLYHEMDIRRLRVREHTAQLSKETAYEYQKEFKTKQIDVLSCSTTFEMGVDVGSLETVFMRNVPPSPANYAQRAGRAGRSLDSAAYALTFCNKSNHDFSFFADPTKMIKGRINPPKFAIENEKIAIRHVYATALSFFWREHSGYFSTVEKMIESVDGMPNGVDSFETYLRGRPAALKEFLERFLPARLCERFGVESFGWVETLLSRDVHDPGVLMKAQYDYDDEVGTLKRAQEEAFKRDKSSDMYLSRIRNYREENILTYMSRKNVMPKYGFPVDTVEMRVGDSRNSLTLQRDLSVAISEYAPGSQVVANGKLITSRYIRRVPKIGWKMYDYKKCACGALNIDVHGGSTAIETCRVCGKAFNEKERIFLVPEFGFTAESKDKTPGLSKPERTYRGEVSYVGQDSEANFVNQKIGGSVIAMDMTCGDEMAVLNESNFFVCDRCGYTELDEKDFATFKENRKHNIEAGFKCGGERLRRYSLGYRFKTDVMQLRFMTHELPDMQTALSVLYALLRGVSRHLDIESSDISGCVQHYADPVSHHAGYALILFDKTPGGAGHVRRLKENGVLQGVLEEALRLMQACTCGGEEGDSSCYACLRDYYNQKYHDILNRGKAIRFIKGLLSEVPAAQSAE